MEERDIERERERMRSTGHFSGNDNMEYFNKYQTSVEWDVKGIWHRVDEL